LTTIFVSCGNNPFNTSDTFKKPVEHITPTKDQEETRDRSEAYCRMHNIPVYPNKNALYFDPEAKITIRTKDEMVDRLLALCFIELKSERADKKLLDKFDKQYNAMAKLSPKEKGFILTDNPTQQQMIDANWRAEGMHVLLWAMGYIDSLAYPDTVCSVSEDVKVIYSKTEQEIRDGARVRNKRTILDQADLILRLDWACTQARLDNKPAPGLLAKDVVTERHYVFNWLIHYLNDDWDDIRTDT
jgi:hypothetical protein